MNKTISNPQQKQAKAALFAVICGLDHFQTLTASLRRPFIHSEIHNLSFLDHAASQWSTCNQYYNKTGQINMKQMFFQCEQNVTNLAASIN